MVKYGFVAFIILLNSLSASAEELGIVILGLFNEQAVVEVNKKRHLLKSGETSPEGVKLIAANSREAILEIKGQRETFVLGDHIGGHFTAAPEQPKVSLWPVNGMYLTAGTINGYSVDFLVDTGATTIALNAATAKRLGIDYHRGQKVGLRTASGYEVGYKISLDYVQIEEIKLYHVTT